MPLKHISGLQWQTLVHKGLINLPSDVCAIKLAVFIAVAAILYQQQLLKHGKITVTQPQEAYCISRNDPKLHNTHTQYNLWAI